MLFKTAKENNPTGKSEFAGQTDDPTVANLSNVARRMTDEPVTHILKTGYGRTAVTSGHFVDAIPKGNFNGKFPWDNRNTEETPPASL